MQTQSKASCHPLHNVVLVTAGHAGLLHSPASVKTVWHPLQKPIGFENIASSFDEGLYLIECTDTLPASVGLVMSRTTDLSSFAKHLPCIVFK